MFFEAQVQWKWLLFQVWSGRMKLFIYFHFESEKIFEFRKWSK